MRPDGSDVDPAGVDHEGRRLGALELLRERPGQAVPARPQGAAARPRGDRPQAVIRRRQIADALRREGGDRLRFPAVGAPKDASRGAVVDAVEPSGIGGERVYRPALGPGGRGDRTVPGQAIELHPLLPPGGEAGVNLSAEGRERGEAADRAGR